MKTLIFNCDNTQPKVKSPVAIAIAEDYLAIVDINNFTVVRDVLIEGYTKTVTILVGNTIESIETINGIVIACYKARDTNTALTLEFPNNVITFR